MAGRLENKRVVVTGAAQGIGLAIAQTFLAEGASLLLIDRDGDLLAAEAERCRVAGGKVSSAAADITDAQAIEEAIARATAEIGRPNALVNNAGVNVFFEPLKMTDADWQRCFDINLKGAWNCSKAVLPGLIEQGGGVILNIASTHAFTIIPHTFPYPVAKHALLGMTKALGLEYAGQGVRVNALAPGYVRTQKVVDYWNGFPDPAAAEAETMKLHPGGRIATPEEIARAALFLVSDECPFINATCLTADGGMTALHHPG